MPLSEVTAADFEKIFVWLKSIYGNDFFVKGIEREDFGDDDLKLQQVYTIGESLFSTRRGFLVAFYE